MPNLSTPPSSELLTLRRSGEGKVAGVCAALADHWDVDPTLVRVGAVLLAVSGGIGAVLYLFGWVWLRSPNGGNPVINRVLPSASGWSTGRLLLVLGLLSAISVLLTSTFLPFGLVPLIVVAVAALIAHTNRPRSGVQPPASTSPPAASPTAPVASPLPPLDPSSEFGRAVSAWQQRLEGLSRGVVDAPDPRPASRPTLTDTPLGVPTRSSTSPLPVTKRRRVSGWYTLISLAAAALAWVVTAQTVTTSSMLLPAAVSLGVVAVALLVASFFGRPRFLVVPGLALAAVVAFSLSPVNPASLNSEQTWSSRAQVPATLRVDNQSLHVDAEQLQLPAASGSSPATPLAVTVRNGVLVLDLPSDLSWTVHYSIHGGALRVADSNVAAGWVDGQLSGGPPGPAQLVMTVDITAGSVTLP